MAQQISRRGSTDGVTEVAVCNLMPTTAVIVAVGLALRLG